MSWITLLVPLPAWRWTPTCEKTSSAGEPGSRLHSQPVPASACSAWSACTSTQLERDKHQAHHNCTKKVPQKLTGQPSTTLPLGTHKRYRTPHLQRISLQHVELRRWNQHFHFTETTKGYWFVCATHTDHFHATNSCCFFCMMIATMPGWQ